MWLNSTEHNAVLSLECHAQCARLATQCTGVIAVNVIDRGYDQHRTVRARERKEGGRSQCLGCAERLKGRALFTRCAMTSAVGPVLCQCSVTAVLLASLRACT